MSRHIAALLTAGALLLGPGAALSQEDPIFDFPGFEAPTFDAPSLPSFDIAAPTPPEPPAAPEFTDFNLSDPGVIPIDPDPLGRVKVKFPFDREEFEESLEELRAALREALIGFGDSIRGRIPDSTP